METDKWFWQQTLRALAPSAAGSDGGNLSVQTDRSRYTAGERVTLTAERTVRRAVIHDLWYNFALPLLLFGLLGIDWLLRLLRGYF